MYSGQAARLNSPGCSPPVALADPADVVPAIHLMVEVFVRPAWSARAARAGGDTGFTAFTGLRTTTPKNCQPVTVAVGSFKPTVGEIQLSPKRINRWAF